jgi:uridine phosphorylase
MEYPDVNNTNTLITPIRTQHEPRIGPDAIMISLTSELRAMAKLSNAEKTSLRIMCPFEFFLIRREGKPPLALAGPLLGAPQAAIVLEKLIALGAKRLWVLGWCGSLQSDLRIGDLIIPTAALSEEGTSAHYPVDEKTRRTDPALSEKLKNALSRANLHYVTGPIWTTDAIYRETRAKVGAYQSTGILAVEMEISALITVSAYRSVALTGVLVVSDELSSLEWRPGFRSDAIRKSSRAASMVLLDLCLNGA